MVLCIIVLGGGSFGMVMVNIVVCNGCDIMIWICDEVVVVDINVIYVNKCYLFDFKFEDGLWVVLNIEEVVCDCDIILVVILSYFFCDVFK